LLWRCTEHVPPGPHPPFPTRRSSDLHFAGLHATREQALAAAEERRAALQPRQSSQDERLRAKALTTARVQFTGQTPEALIAAAEAIYQWLKHGNLAPRR